MNENNRENMTVEETVEELKKQIQEISDESDEIISQNEKIRPQVEQIKDNAVELLNKCIDTIKDTANDVMKSEQLQKSMSFVSEKSKAIVEETK